MTHTGSFIFLQEQYTPERPHDLCRAALNEKEKSGGAPKVLGENECSFGGGIPPHSRAPKRLSGLGRAYEEVANSRW